MKFVRQFSLILMVTFLGEVLRTILPFPIPASVYGLVLMLLALHFKLIKVEHVKETGSFLIELMPIMFVPAAVGLMLSWADLESMLIPALVITLVTTIFVMVITGKATQFMLRADRKESV